MTKTTLTVTFSISGPDPADLAPDLTQPEVGYVLARMADALREYLAQRGHRATFNVKARASRTSGGNGQ